MKVPHEALKFLMITLALYADFVCKTQFIS